MTKRIPSCLAGVIATALLFALSPAAHAQTAPALAVTFADPAWNGEKIPAGQQCKLFGGAGATPALKVSGIPEGATVIVLEFNDRDYFPLSRDGGHGKIGFAVSGAEAVLPAVPGHTAEGLPPGSFIVAPAQSWAEYASPGYLPPCSGGTNHRYVADVKAVAMPAGGSMGDGKVLATIRVALGKY